MARGGGIRYHFGVEKGIRPEVWRGGGGGGKTAVRQGGGKMGVWKVRW